MGCSLSYEDESAFGVLESEREQGQRRWPSRDPGSADPRPQSKDFAGGGEGAGAATVTSLSTGDGGDGGETPSFIDACLLPGMTKATFNPTSSFDASDEGATAALPLPFPFTLYGTTHSKYWITTNGQIGFGSTIGGSAFGQVRCPLPDTRFTTPILLVYSVDLVGRYEPEAGVCYATVGTAPNRKLVVTWKDSFFYESWLTSHVTFSAVLSEGTNAIDVMLGHIEAPNMPVFEDGGASVLGKQASKTGYYAYSCFQTRAPEGAVVHYP